jgi:membrane protease YdiL (CAAX protease family)
MVLEFSHGYGSTLTAAAIMTKNLLFYYAIAAIILLLAYLTPTRGSEFVTSLPVFVSLLLLIPLFVWQHHVRRNANLPRTNSERFGGSAFRGVALLFLLALTVRVPSVLWFGVPYEKTPLIFLLVLTILLVEKTNLDAFGFRTEKMVKSLLTGAGFFLAFAGVSLAISHLLIYIFTRQAPVQSFDLASSLLVMPFMIFCVAVSEEAFFRGYTQTRFEEHHGFRWAIAVQAALFGLWHFVWNLSPFDPSGMAQYMASTFLFGLLFGYLYYKTKSLIPVVLAHGLWDSIPPWIIGNGQAIDSFSMLPGVDHIFVLLLSTAISVLVAFLYVKYVTKRI